ncbi:MAG: glutamate--tRNA ligase family protein [Acinetobacter sp.]
MMLFQTCQRPRHQALMPLSMPCSKDNGQAWTFVRQVITDDLKEGRTQKVVTRFPPEPNGYLHISHVKAICLNFGIAEEFDGLCNLRFDDTNPDAEEQEYVDGIANDMASG